MGLSDFQERIKKLSAQEMNFVYSRLLENIESSAGILTPEESMSQQVAEDLLNKFKETYLKDETDLGGNEEIAADLLINLGEYSDDYRQVIAGALEELNQKAVRLDAAMAGFALNTLIIAIGGAILRPHVSFEKDENGKTKFDFEIQGTDKIVDIIKAVLGAIIPGK